MMFTQAGFRDDYRVIASAKVSRRGDCAVADAYLVQWPGCNDYHWASRAWIASSEQVIVHEVLRVRPGETVPLAALTWLAQ